MPDFYSHHQKFEQALRNWCRELELHDSKDYRGLIEGLGVALLLVASRLRYRPSTSPMSELDAERWQTKIGLWKAAIADLLEVDIAIHDDVDEKGGEP